MQSLCTSQWLSLFANLVVVGSPRVQRRLTRLLQRLVPHLRPSDVLHVQLPRLHTSQGGAIVAECGGDLIPFFLDCVAMLRPPGVPFSALQAAATHGGEEEDREEGGGTRSSAASGGASGTGDGGNDGDDDENDPDDDDLQAALAMSMADSPSVSPTPTKPSEPRLVVEATEAIKEHGALHVRPSKSAFPVAAQMVILLRLLHRSELWTDAVNEVLTGALAEANGTLDGVTARLQARDTASAAAEEEDATLADLSKETVATLRHVVATQQLSTANAAVNRALAALCVVGGHVPALREGGVVTIMSSARPSPSPSTRSVNHRGSTSAGVGAVGAGSASGAATAPIASDVNAAEEGLPEGQGLLVSYSPGNAVAKVAIADPTTGAQQVQSFAVDDLRSVDELPVSAQSVVPELCLTLLSVTSRVLDTCQSFVASTADDDDDNDDDDDDGGDGDGAGGRGSSKPSLGGFAGAITDGRVTFKMPASDHGHLDIVDAYMLQLHAVRALGNVLQHQSLLQQFIDEVQREHDGSSDVSMGGEDGPRFSPGELLHNLFALAVTTTGTNGLSDVPEIEETWLLLWARWHELLLTRRNEVARAAAEALRQLKAGPGGEEDEDMPQASAPASATSAADTASASAPAAPATSSAASPAAGGADGGDDDAATEPSPACQMLMDMGFERAWCELALDRSGVCVGAVLLASCCVSCA